jgi:hypothetical protein
MFPISNPFARGYQNLHVVRTLLITDAADGPPIWRPLHASQAHLPDHQVQQLPCLVGKDFALITVGQDVPQELKSQCDDEGLVRAIVYAVEGIDIDRQPVHVGDFYSEAKANEVIRRSCFETGSCSRCWEISSAHLTEPAHRYLLKLADLEAPEGFPLIAFHLPGSFAVGVKLIATPWANVDLRSAESITAAQLRQSYRVKGVSETIGPVLQLAAEASVRILIFDPDAPALDGLPVYEGMSA